MPTKLGDRPQRYRVAWNDVASPEYSRSLKASLIPPSSVCGDKVPTFTYPAGDTWQYMPWLAAANSLCLDALARRLISLKMSMTVMDSLPFPRWAEEAPTARELAIRARSYSTVSSTLRPPRRASTASSAQDVWRWRHSTPSPRERSTPRRGPQVLPMVSAASSEHHRARLPDELQKLLSKVLGNAKTAVAEQMTEVETLSRTAQQAVFGGA